MAHRLEGELLSLAVLRDARARLRDDVRHICIDEGHDEAAEGEGEGLEELAHWGGGEARLLRWRVAGWRVAGGTLPRGAWRGADGWQVVGGGWRVAGGGVAGSWVAARASPKMSCIAQ